MVAVTSQADDVADIGAVAGLSRVLLAALEQTRSATCITTADLDEPGPQIVYVNPAYCAMTGRDRRDVLGSTPRLMQGPLTDRRVLDRLRSDLAAGRSFSGETVNYRTDRTPFVINWSIDPVVDADGVVTHYVATQEDVTARVRASALLDAERQLDAELTRIIDSALDAPGALDALVAQVLAGASSIATIGSVVATVADDEFDLSVAAGTRFDEGRSAPFASSRPGSSAGVVIEVTGLRPEEEEFLDRAGLEAFAARAGAVVAALVEYQRQRLMALRLQHDLLPRPDVGAPGFTVVSTYRPGTRGLDVGGDWFDVAVTDARVVFSVGDVSGRGIGAAALMGRLRLLADVEFRRSAPVGDVLALLDEVCAREQQFATMLVMAFDRRVGTAEVWSAGHLPPIRFGPDGAGFVEVAVAPPLGHLGAASPRSMPVDLAVGQGLLAFTDGLVERRGESLDDGLGRLRRAVAGAVDPARVIEAAVGDVGDDIADDMALLALRRDR
jgi:PAS domain S-box-containing protein